MFTHNTHSMFFNEQEIFRYDASYDEYRATIPGMSTALPEWTKELEAFWRRRVGEEEPSKFGESMLSKFPIDTEGIIICGIWPDFILVLFRNWSGYEEYHVDDNGTVYSYTGTSGRSVQGVWNNAQDILGMLDTPAAFIDEMNNRLSIFDSVQDRFLEYNAALMLFRHTVWSKED